MDFIKKIFLFFKKNPVLFLGIVYFLLRLPKLTLIPIFNDESIYLDWAWRETHVPGFLYYSLYDAKQPLVMWLFGFFSNFFSDPLYAGRFVNLCLGFTSTIGLYFVGKEYFDKRIGLIAALLYTAIPIFVLFDRQALLESAITACCIWSFFFLTRSLQKERSIKSELLTGVILGLGYFSKSTAILFFVTAIFCIFYLAYKKRKPLYLKRTTTIGGAFLLVILLLIINPVFWKTLPSNSRYVLGIGEVLHFPVRLWLQNMWAFLHISFLFLTPPVFILSFGATFEFIKNRKNILLLTWVFAPLVIAMFTLKAPSQRYIVGLLPLFTLLASHVLLRLFEKFKAVGITVTIITFFFSLQSSYFLMHHPISYFSFFNKITPYSEYGFIDGQVSGYGIAETVDYLVKENDKKPMVLTFAENTGNPESAMSVYAAKRNIMNGYFELKYLVGLPPETECIEMENGYDIYFISRNRQLAGFERFVKEIKTIKKPLSKESIGIYKFISGCKKVMRVNPVFHPQAPS